eukprot:2717692-Alexandrium_andersonii.AAC.1
MASDGRACLCDGKHTMLALDKIADIYKDETSRQQHEWTATLLEALVEWVTVSGLEFPEDDYDLV